MSDDARPTLHVLRGELDAAPVSRPAEAPAAAAPDGPAPGAAPPRKRGRERKTGEIWPGCPVVALGVHGATFWYLDLLGQLVPIDNHTGDRISAVFGGRVDLLTRAFPRYGKDGESVIGWKQDGARAAMQAACAERGVLDAAAVVRGRGAWVDAEGALILHAGDAVLIAGEWRPPGDHAGHVYASRPPSPRPAETPDPEAGERLLDLLSTWRWQRGALDAQLMLGWIGAAMVSGALDWRPAAWVTGDAGTGKSTLQDLVRHVLGGEGGVLQSTDATPAGLWQQLRQDALPVALDEIEPDDDGRSSRVRDIIKLARQAASGGVTLRGGADHKGTAFKARSAFLFSSILVPPLLDQDVSRLAVLDLEPLPKGAAAPKLAGPELGRLGRAVRRQLLDQWPRWRETLEVHRLELGRVGHSQRGADQFGTLLAMADLLLFDDVPAPGRAAHWAEQLRAQAAGAASGASQDWERLAAHLLGQVVDPWRGGTRRTVGELCLAARGDQADDLPEPGQARSALAQIGLKVEGEGKAARLLVANQSPGLARLLEGSRWAAGAGTTGVWSQSLRRVPDAIPGLVRRFSGLNTRCVSVPLQALMGGDDGDAAPPAPFPSDDSPQF